MLAAITEFTDDVYLVLGPVFPQQINLPLI